LAATFMTPERLNRITWRCRRGMLENDLVLARFLEARGPALTEDEVTMLDRLLDLTDNDLWDLIAGRQEPQDQDVVPLLSQLRAA
jgi:antitoxin CptB